MQTELHHLQTLHVMAEVFRRGMKREVQLDGEAVERVFPCLDQLLAFHRAFFGAMKERRLGSAQPPGHRNYLVQHVGDVLLQQVSVCANHRRGGESFYILYFGGGGDFSKSSISNSSPLLE